MFLRIKNFFHKVGDILTPLSVIASELRVLRELYELDLSSRTPPIIRVTESPGSNDTVVTYDEVPEDKSKLQDLIEEWEAEDVP